MPVVPKGSCFHRSLGIIFTNACANLEILYIGSEGGLESKIIPQAGIDYRAIPSGKFRRYHKSNLLNIIDLTTIYKNSVDFFRFLKGYFKARKIIKDYPELKVKHIKACLSYAADKERKLKVV